MLYTSIDRKIRNKVGTRLDLVRNSLIGGHRLMNHGRDPIGSLPYSMYLLIFGVSFLETSSFVGVGGQAHASTLEGIMRGI